ncbi:MAG: tetratricopeptide repeat protein [Myxococcota bacterium]
MLALALFLFASAFAQSPNPESEPPPAELDEARKLYSLATQWYEEGQYERAVEAFQKAYAMTEAPEILFNIANAQERGGLLREALETLERYRLYAPDSEQTTIRRRVLAIEERLERASPPEPIEVPNLPPSEPEPAIVTPSEPEFEPTRRRPRWGLVAAGASTAAISGGVAIGSFQTSRTAIASGDPSSYAVSRTVNNVALVGVGAGVALAAIGFVVPRPADSTWNIGMGPAGAELMVRF